MAWFEEFRNENGFTSYADNRTAVTADIPLLVVTYFCVLISIATLIATLGIRGREKWSSAIRACYAVAIGSIILACLVGHGWQEGEVQVKCPYVYRSNLPFEGKVGLKVALHYANVTLEGYYRGASGSGYVYYAEKMEWADFGHQPERYSYFLQRGLPDPVLKVMEFLTVDGGGLRWGRSFHQSGHYACALLWTAFAFWLCTNVLLFSVVVYGAYTFFLTGLAMVLACVSYHACQNDLPLVIAFGDADLTISYGWSFWLTLVAGLVTVVLGVMLIILDHFAHEGVSGFFHLEKLDDEEIFEIETDKQNTNLSNLIDRRGSVVPPPPTDRRGSIFLEPGRRPSWYMDNLRRTTVLNLGGLANKSFEPEPGFSKNPCFGMDTKIKTSSLGHPDDDVKKVMEQVCLDSDVCMSTKKPSLATLKEHRDNHANERIFTNTNGQDVQPAPSLSKPKRRGSSCSVTFSDDSVKIDSLQPDDTANTKTEEQEKMKDFIKPKRARNESETSQGLVSNDPKIPHITKVKIQAETYGRQISSQSTDSDTSTASSSLDSGHGVSCEYKPHETGGKHSSDDLPRSGGNSKRSRLSENSGVVLNITTVDRHFS